MEKNPTIVNFPISFDMAEFIETKVSDKYKRLVRKYLPGGAYPMFSLVRMRARAVPDW